MVGGNSAYPTLPERLSGEFRHLIGNSYPEIKDLSIVSEEKHNRSSLNSGTYRKYALSKQAIIILIRISLHVAEVGLLTWIGGSIVGSLSIHPRAGVSLGMWDEQGPYDLSVRAQLRQY